jgi:uncharacterized membrane protein
MKRYLIAGLLVWVPLGITMWVLHFLVTSLDSILLLLPETARPETLLGFYIPGIGVVVAFLICSSRAWRRRTSSACACCAPGNRC